MHVQQNIKVNCPIEGSKLIQNGIFWQPAKVRYPRDENKINVCVGFVQHNDGKFIKSDALNLKMFDVYSK